MNFKSFLPAFAALIFLITGCAEHSLFTEPESGSVLKSANAKLKIAVISDIHYMDHSLLPVAPEENADFQALLFNGYNKVVEMSEPVFLETVSELKREKPDVLLIPGDLAFNGELVNHQIVRAKLQELADAGTQILVVPGNNDINSPDAMSYEGTGSTPVPNVTPAEFVSIYGDFGYNGALYRDVNSLSYIFQLRDGLWILGIDACIYTPASKRSGTINAGTMTWIQEKMAEANENGILVLAMMHHGIAEHYTGQSTLLKGDVVNNFAWVSTSLMDAGIRFVFTGHSHANDIVEAAGDGKSIFDIETGSLITPSSPYRIVSIIDNYLKADTRRITRTDASLPAGESFITYSDSYLAEHLDLFFQWYLVNVFNLQTEMAEASLPCLRNAMMAQFSGDEKLLPPEAGKIETLNEMFPGNPVVPVVNSFWTDLPPEDDSFHAKIK